MPSLIYQSDTDESGDESDADAGLLRADADSLTVANLKMLAVEKFGTRDFDEMKTHYITAPSENVRVKLEIRRGLVIVRNISKQSPLYGMLHKHDIISTINGADMNGLTVSGAEKLLNSKRKRQVHLLVFRIQCDEREPISSPASSVVSVEGNDENVDISGSLHVCCRKGDVSLI